MKIYFTPQEIKSILKKSNPSKELLSTAQAKLEKTIQRSQEGLKELRSKKS